MLMFTAAAARVPASMFGALLTAFEHPVGTRRHLSSLLPDQVAFEMPVGGMFAIASVVGPLCGGLLSDHASWRWCFYINVPVGVVAFVMLFLAFKKNKAVKDTRHLDIAGTCLVCTFVVLIELALTWGGTKYQWSDPIIIVMLVVGVFLLIPFVFIQRDHEAPILPLTIFRIRNVTIACLTAFFMGIPFYIGFIYLPVWFQTVQDYDATHSGLQMLAFMLSLIISSMVSGGVMTKTGRYRPMLWIGSFLMPIGYGLVAMLKEDSGQGLIIPLQLLMGTGIGTFMQILTTMSQNAVEMKEMAVVTTAVTFFRTIGASLGIALFSAISLGIQKTLVAQYEADGTQADLFAKYGPVDGGKALAHRIANEMITRTFLYTLPFAILPFLLLLFTVHVPLRTAPGGSGNSAPSH